jgi:XTP/dITP diphosphohydrolase
MIAAVLASQNRHKLAELRAVLAGWEIEPLEAAPYPEETGETYDDNALIKARFAHDHVPPGTWALGEDSGIECVALGGGPGLHSARWAPGRDQADALLERLEGEEERRARMVSTLVAISPEGEELRGHGTLEGSLANERRGSAGFGYDPVFIPAGEMRTVAEIGEEWKNRHSHRAQAALAIARAVAGSSPTTS